MTENWIKELVIGQVVYLQKTEADNKVRLSPVLVERVDKKGGIIFKHPPVGSLQFNSEGQIIFWGSDTPSDQKIVLAPEGTKFNDPDKIIDGEEV